MKVRKQKKKQKRADNAVVEFLGRNILIAQLMDAGLEVAIPARDRGVDLIAFQDCLPKDNNFTFIPIQLKASSSGSFSIHKKHGRIQNLLMAYVWCVRHPSESVTYAMRYADAVKIGRKPRYTETPSWRKRGGYSTSRPGKEIRRILEEKHRMTSENWRRLAKAQSMKS